jgi:hypothetical protein
MCPGVGVLPSMPGICQAVEMESPERQRREIVDYLRTQARDESVEHAEKIASERVFGRSYDVWDVHSDKGSGYLLGGCP